MRIALTGATGTIGAAFADRARSDGHELVLLAREIPEDRGDLGDWCEFDLGADRVAPATMEALRGVDVAVHLAARIDTTPVDDAAALALFETNVLGTGRLLRALAEAGVSRMVMASSANIYDPRVAIADEDTAIRPTSRTLYLSSKVAQEAYARQLCAEAGIACAIMRISSVVGTGTDLVSRFVAKALAGERIPLDNPDYGSDFVALEDVVAGMLFATEASLEGEFNLSSGARHTLGEIVALIGARSGREPLIDCDAASSATDSGFPAIDCTRLLAHGYRPRHLAALIDEILATKTEVPASNAAEATP